MQLFDKLETARRNIPTRYRDSGPGLSIELEGILLQTSYALPAPSHPSTPETVFGHAANRPHVLRSHQPEFESMSQLKTFIVEDSPVIRESLIATLEELVPVQVVGTAEDESTAVSWLSTSNNHADLVIVDIFLKGGSGLGVLRAAHALAKEHTLVVLSNYATPDIRRKCLELGADRVFDKSNEIDALIQYCADLAAGNTGHGGLTN